MALTNWAYIYLSPNFNKQIQITESESCRFKSIGIDFKDKEDALQIAKELVSEGVQLIELCGGFGPLWVAKVIDAIGGQVPVGSVFYGPEDRKPLLDLITK